MQIKAMHTGEVIVAARREIGAVRKSGSAERSKPEH
jgi:hypothetical protein